MTGVAEILRHQLKALGIGEGFTDVLVDFACQHARVLEHFFALGQCGELVGFVVVGHLVVIRHIQNVTTDDVLGHRDPQRHGTTSLAASRQGNRARGHLGIDAGVVQRADGHIALAARKCSGAQCDAADVGIRQTVDQVEGHRTRRRNAERCAPCTCCHRGRGCRAQGVDGGTAIGRNQHIAAHSDRCGRPRNTTDVGQHVVVDVVARHRQAH